MLTGKTWNIPQDAKRPARTNKKPEAPRTLLDVLQNEMTGQVKGGIYHKIQIDLTYNSNHIEGSRLTHDQTRYIYATTSSALTLSSGMQRNPSAKRLLKSCTLP